MPGKVGFRYVYSPSHIINILKKIRETNRPPKVTTTHITKNWLLKNDQYSACLDILKDMEFLDASGVPTKLYAQYQGGKYKVALAQGIRIAYKHIFDVYANANELPKKDIEDYFKTQTGITTSVLDKMVATFTTLCSLADFSEGQPIQEEEEQHKPEVQAKGEKNISKFKLEPNIIVNIGINIAADTQDEKIKTFFKYMKEYLLKPDNE